MAYKRRYKRRRGRRNRYNGYLSTAAKALSVAYGVKKLVNAEKHVHDMAFPSPVSTTASVSLVNSVAGGTAEQERTGNSIRIKSLQCKGILTQAAAATTSVLRLVLFIDRENFGTDPSAADIGIATVQAMRNDDHKALRRFHIISDKTIFFADANRQQALYNVFRKLDHVALYDGPAATGQSQGAIYLLAVSDQATNTVAMQVTARIRYMDN